MWRPCEASVIVKSMVRYSSSSTSSSDSTFTIAQNFTTSAPKPNARSAPTSFFAIRLYVDELRPDETTLTIAGPMLWRRGCFSSHHRWSDSSGLSSVVTSSDSHDEDALPPASGIKTCRQSSALTFPAVWCV